LLARDVLRSRSKSPDLVDHLVTFIACEIVTSLAAYRNFRELFGRDLADCALRQSLTAAVCVRPFPD
jgi:hypothetical protein